MSKKKTYLYIQDGHEEGLYLDSQIVRMADAGIIRADAVISCVEDTTKGSLIDFLASLEKELNGASRFSGSEREFMHEVFKNFSIELRKAGQEERARLFEQQDSKS